MAEIDSPTNAAAPSPGDRIEDLQIEKELQDSYMTYAMSTIMDRALPDVRDGLKPSQRRILVAMNDLDLGPRSKHRKCAKIAGDTSGNYHPHGESVIYPTLVRMAQHWSLRYPLIDGREILVPRTVIRRRPCDIPKRASRLRRWNCSRI